MEAPITIGSAPNNNPYIIYIEFAIAEMIRNLDSPFVAIEYKLVVSAKYPITSISMESVIVLCIKFFMEVITANFISLIEIEFM